MADAVAQRTDTPPPAAVQLARTTRTAIRVDCILDLIGNTPLVRLGTIDRDCPAVEIWAKCEFANPGGSVKDRAAKRIITDALARGDLDNGVRLVDSTSGNTGIAYSLVGAALGLPISLVMPSNVSNPRKQVTAGFGTEIIFSDPMEGSDGAIVIARELAEANPDKYYYPNQYANDSNWRAHYDGTGPEILAQTNGRVTHFVTGIGTSGTIMGTARFLHDHDPSIQCIGVQPDDAMHGLEGLKHIPSSLVPPIYDESVLDDTIWMSTEVGWDMAERIASDEGLFVGHSAGGNVAAALHVARGLVEQGKRGVVVTVLCDRGDRYFAPLTWEKHYVW
ncbi:MAG: pyridoxal-phosphate dependent enzyme [Nannocystaceae bacterium]|nr:pyridoxal-phosphate dependent enzyme [Nannocystaceae bacterium]